MRIVLIAVLVLFTGVVFHNGSVCGASPAGRFFHDGDGRLKLNSRKNTARFSGQYRSGGRYDPAAIQAIQRVFGVPADSSGRVYLDLRLIAFLDFIQDHFNPEAVLTITSGYRSPAYNRSIRKKGALAAKASLHQYGMAADLIMEGVPSRRIWQFVKKLGFGGAGYYHGQTVHLDVGPARSWDEKTSGVGTGLSDDNKLIGIVCNFDRYAPGEVVALRFIRMTAFPVGVSPTFELLEAAASGQGARTITAFKPEFAIEITGTCPAFATIDDMDNIAWRLPRDLPSGRYRIRSRFCGRDWPDMPSHAVTPVFEVK